MNNYDFNDANRVKGFLIGTLGSVAGLLAMRYYWELVAPKLRNNIDLGGTDAYPDNLDWDDISVVNRQPDEDESPTAVVGSKVYQAITGLPPDTEKTEETLSNITHWGYGMLQGGLYGATRAANSTDKGLDVAGGASFGLGLWLLGDEVAVPMLGLQGGPTSVSPTTHINRLGAHLVYGVATAVTTQLLHRIL